MKLTREQMLELTASELIEIHNQTDPDNPITNPKWSKAKTALVDLIFEAGYETKPEPTRSIRAAALEMLCEVVYYEDKTIRAKKDNVVPKEHKNARSVGVPYLEIIDRLKDEFPDCNTSPACLRWYAVKVRAGEFGYEDYRLAQRRPRARPQT